MRLRWRRSPRVLGIAAAIVVASAGLPAGIAIAAHGVESHLAAEVRQGQAALDQGRAGLEAGYAHRDQRLVRQAGTSFARSLSAFDQVAAQARDLGPVAGGGSPAFVRSRVASLSAVAAMAGHVDRAGIAASTALLDAGLTGSPATASALVSLLEPVRAELAAARRAAAGIDLGVVPAGDRAQLQHGIADLTVADEALDQAWPSLPALLDLLGFDGPRTFLVEQVNPSELRSGGGFIGTVSLVRTDAGRVELDRSLPVEAFDFCDAVGCVHPRPLPWQPGYVAPPSELTGYPLPPWSRLTAWSLEDSGFYPDFASNAQAAERFGDEELHVHLDGVIAADFYAVAPLLDLTGPLPLPKFHLTLTSTNFVSTIVGLDLARTPDHKDVISAAASQIVAALGHVGAANAGRLLQVLRDEVRGRHVQAYFNDPAIQAQAARLDVTDTLDPARVADFFMETEDNYGGSKANHFLTRTFALTLNHTGTSLQHVLTVDVTDRAPADQPWIGPHYTSYFRLYVPASARHLALTSAPSEEYPPVAPPGRRSQVPPDGSQVTGGWVFVQVGPGLSGHFQVTFSYATPWAPGADGVDRIAWQKQPGTIADVVRVTFHDGARTFTAIGDLGADRVLTLSDAGVRILPAT